jgi:hypothetical protein
MCNKEELMNVPESVGEAILANTNTYIKLIMCGVHEAVPSSKVTDLINTDIRWVGNNTTTEQ